MLKTQSSDLSCGVATVYHTSNANPLVTLPIVSFWNAIWRPIKDGFIKFVVPFYVLRRAVYDNT